MQEISLFSLIVILFIIMDPIGNIASYLALTNGLTPKRRHIVLLREMGIALSAMIIISFIGDYIFKLLGISQCTVRLASGAILFLIAIKILFPSTDSLRSNLPKGEPFIIPLAIPLIAGPSLLATIMMYADLIQSRWMVQAAIGIAWIAALGVLWVAPFLNRYLGSNGLVALEKLTGMILVLLAVQRLAEGIQRFIADCA
jgi:multiple antibiotic resistance protein